MVCSLHASLAASSCWDSPLGGLKMAHDENSPSRAQLFLNPAEAFSQSKLWVKEQPTGASVEEGSADSEAIVVMQELQREDCDRAWKGPAKGKL